MINTEIDKIEKVAQEADLIVNSYAFVCENENVSVLNLNDMDKALMMNRDGEVLATSMDDIEIGIVKRYWEKNKEFAEAGIVK